MSVAVDPKYRYISKRVRLSLLQSILHWLRTARLNAEWQRETTVTRLIHDGDEIPAGWRDTGFKAGIDSWRDKGPKVNVHAKA